MPPRPSASPLSVGQVLEPARDFVVGRTYLVSRGTVVRPATVLNSRKSRTGAREAYISFVGEDKRLDAWVAASALGEEVATAGPSRLAGVIEAALTNGAASPIPLDSERSTPEREHDIVTRVRNFEDVRFGEYLIRTWYYSPYPMQVDGGPSAQPDVPAKRGRKRKEAPSTPVADDLKSSTRSTGPRTATDLLAGGVGKDGEGAMGRLWVCDLCFKYMRTRAGWDSHISSCKMLQPPGLKVYQRGSYTIWEVDGAEAQLYCQNLCLFGKLFIDHKSIYFHMENFLFYVLCDAATSRRDQVLAFFSKEKHSYDDYNLACIVTFPPFQNRGFGKLLMEFSYYLTRHPKTRSASGSPGTPERPLSDLGFKGYMAYWVAVVLRLCRSLLAEGASTPVPEPKAAASEGRSLRTRKPAAAPVRKEGVVVNGVELVKQPEPSLRGHYSVTTTLKSLAQACHLRVDDVELVLRELGFLRYRRAIPPRPIDIDSYDDGGETHSLDDHDTTEWTNVELVITREAVDEQWAKWRVRDAGVLDEKYALLDRY